MKFLCILALAFLASGDPDGSLVISSQPGVEVLWEGVALGQTDEAGALTVEGIPQGRFRLTLEKPGYESLTLSVTISDEAKTLRAKLRQLPATAPARAKSPKPTPRASKPTPKPRDAVTSTPTASAMPKGAVRPSMPGRTSARSGEADAVSESVPGETAATAKPGDSGESQIATREISGADSPATAADAAANLTATPSGVSENDNPSAGGWSGWPIFFLLAMVGAALTIWLRKVQFGQAILETVPEPRQIQESAPAAAESSLLDEIREREESLDEVVDTTRNVVEVEVTEVRDLDEESE